jgi:murein hydrolase activator
MIVLLLSLLLPLLSGAQSREELERNKQNIEREIRIISQMLQETKKTAEVNLNHLVMLNNQINRRENLLRTINNEISFINRRISALNHDIEELNRELKELREDYAALIRHAHRSRDNTTRMMFLLSSASFNQAMLRMRYLQQYARHRQQQAEKIEATQQELTASIASLEEERSRQQQALRRQQQELEELSQEKQSQNQTVTALQRKEKELMTQLREQERAARDLQAAIQRIIAEERKKAQEQARAEGRVTTDMFALTPEEQLLSDNFAENRGKLMWPVERGVITGRFGQQPHPVLPGIQISNNGIDISTSQGANARAIFDGTVSRVISVPGAYYAVIIRHGEYLSVYSNLSEVFVRNGQRVSMREELGVVATNSREAKTFIHLEIWKGNDKLNPAIWLAQQR